MTLNLDLTSSLPSSITFARAGTRNYITGGVLTALATGTPAFESWDGVNRGLAIEPAFTNLQTYSNDFSQAIWTKSAGAMTTGDVGPGLITQMFRFDSTATASYHRLITKPGSQASGLTQTFSCFVKAASGANTYSVWLQMAAEFNNAGLIHHFRIDGNEGFYSTNDGVDATNVRYGYRKLSGNIYQVWVTGTWAATGSKQFQVGVSAKTATDTRTYTATVNDSFQLFGASVSTTRGPVGYVATGAATASQAAESAIFNDTAWLTSTAQGTFVVEHDCWTGPIIGSGANTVLGATVPGKTAIAWSGSTSDTVNNGGASSSGVQPTFSGSDVRLLSTSGTTNTGHIKSIRFYPTRLSVAELQVLTAPSLVSTATPGVLRTVSVNNRLPSTVNVTTGALLTFSSRFEVSLGGHDCSELRLDFPNIRFAAETTIGNALNITSVALERETGVAEFAPVYVGGSRSFTVATDAAATVVSDAILPAAFTGLSVFPANMKFWVRVQGSVTTAGHNIAAAREGTETGACAKIYNPASSAFSPVDATGPMVYVSGTDSSNVTRAYCPILVGKFASGDPKTLFVVGDSIIEGVGNLGGTGTFVRLACITNGTPQIEMSCGGKSQLEVASNLNGWKAYMAYSRVLVDEMGRNNSNAILAVFDYYKAAKATYGYDKIFKLGLLPSATSSDSFATEANQTVTRPYPSNNPDAWMTDLLKYEAVDYVLDPQSVRGVAAGKWKVTGAAFYSTVDGTHQSDAGNNLLATEIQPRLAAVTVT